MKRFNKKQAQQIVDTMIQNQIAMYGPYLNNYTGCIAGYDKDIESINNLRERIAMKIYETFGEESRSACDFVNNNVWPSRTYNQDFLVMTYHIDSDDVKKYLGSNNNIKIERELKLTTLLS